MADLRDYEVTVSEAEEMLATLDKLLENPPNPGGMGHHERYLQGLKDALGWVLGYYDKPDVE